MAAPKNPKGAKSDKLWRDAIMLAVHRVRKGDDSRKSLFRLADKLVDKAMEGDTVALKEIGDRLDGKPTQQVDVGNKDGSPLKIDIEVSFKPK